MAYREQSYIGKGVPYLGLYDGSDKKRDVGNCSELIIGTETEEKELLNSRTCGGGKVNKIDRITAVTVTMKLTDFNEENLALALYGESSAVASDAVTDEDHADAYHDGLLRFDFIYDPATPPVIKDGTNTTTYAEGTDYELTSSGIIPLSTGTMVDGDPVKVSYTKKAGYVIQALTTGSTDFAMTFEGLNEAQNCTPVVIDLYRVKFSPAEALGFIADDYGEISLTGEVLLDSTRTAASGQYLKIEQA